MKRQKWVIFITTLALIAGAACLLAELRLKQNLGSPAVKTAALAGTKRLQVELPERVLDYESKPLEPQKIELDTLPPDTSFGKREYRAPDGFEAAIDVVLMGSDRTSLHKPEFCLMGQGWRLDLPASGQDKVRMDRPFAYDLPVSKLVASKQVKENGQDQTWRIVYVYWFVADHEYTARHWQRMWWMARDMMRTGVLQRWAYITYSAICLPGQEDACFERLKKLIAASAPDFQLYPEPVGAITAAGR